VVRAWPRRQRAGWCPARRPRPVPRGRARRGRAHGARRWHGRPIAGAGATSGRLRTGCTGRGPGRRAQAGAKPRANARLARWWRNAQPSTDRH
jgi:hypothetical protein